MKKIGKIRTNIDVSEEYYALAEKDEIAGRFLKNQSLYRNAVYFFIQAMEKYVRSKIFKLVNPNNEYFRNKNKNHSLNTAIEFLIEIVSTDDIVNEQIKKQIEIFVLEEFNFSFLHYNLRYPFYSGRHDNYSVIDFDENDCLFIENKLEILKKFLEKLY
jgi:hypothetical protein